MQVGKERLDVLTTTETSGASPLPLVAAEVRRAIDAADQAGPSDPGAGSDGIQQPAAAFRKERVRPLVLELAPAEFRAAWACWRHTCYQCFRDAFSSCYIVQRQLMYSRSQVGPAMRRAGRKIRSSRLPTGDANSSVPRRLNNVYLPMVVRLRLAMTAAIRVVCRFSNPSRASGRRARCAAVAVPIPSTGAAPARRSGPGGSSPGGGARACAAAGCGGAQRLCNSQANDVVLRCPAVPRMDSTRPGPEPPLTNGSSHKFHDSSSKSGCHGQVQPV